MILPAGALRLMILRCLAAADRPLTRAQIYAIVNHNNKESVGSAMRPLVLGGLVKITDYQRVSNRSTKLTPRYRITEAGRAWLRQQQAPRVRTVRKPERAIGMDAAGLMEVWG